MFMNLQMLKRIEMKNQKKMLTVLILKELKLVLLFHFRRLILGWNKTSCLTTLMMAIATVVLSQ